ncbi:MAG: AAA family ATPase [Deltaproteobacteria bacterium]|nr:AAA family ATPase [Deltaproteobacteria bacterium]
MAGSVTGPVFRSANFAIPPGSLFAERFRIGRVAGVGGMGRIYEAIDEKTGARVALKTMSVSGVDSVVVDRFEREISILKSVTHPNLVRALDGGRDREGTLFLALEWLDGVDLSDRLTSGPIPLIEACRIGRGALRGLLAVHRAKIVHRDMKPGNIFLLRASEPPAGVKLLDFGVAKLLEDQLKATGGGLTLEGTVIGTPYYMSPEQAQGRDDVDWRADLFSLAAVVFECISGQRPYAGSSALALLLRIASDRPRSIREIDPTIPIVVEEFFTVALSRDRERRFQSADEMERALEKLEESLLGDQPTATDFRPDSVPFQWSSVARTTEPQAVFEATVPSPPADPVSVVSVMVAELEDGEHAFEAFARSIESEGGEAMPARGRIAVGVFAGADDGPLRASRVGRRVVAESCAIRAAVGSVAPDDRDATARAGDAIESAVGLVALAGQREVVIDSETHRSIGNAFPTRPRGKDARVVSESVARSTKAWAASDFVGRRAELEALVETFERTASTREASFTFVTGPAGSGKSRLAEELARRISRGPIRAVVMKSFAERTASRTPLFVFADAFRRRASIVSSESEVTIAAKLDLLVPKSVGAANRERAVSAVARLVGVHPIELSRGGDGAARSFPSLLRALVGMANENPLAILIEEFEWIDPVSATVIEELLDAARALPLFIVAFADPAASERLSRVTALARRVELPEVEEAAIESLAKSIRADLPDEDLRKIARQAVGRPGLALALLHAPGTADRARDPKERLALLADARVAGLSKSLSSVLSAASVIGTTFWEDALDYLGERDVRDALDELATEGFIEARDTTRYPASHELVFRGEAIWKAAYARAVDLEGKHRKVAEWLRSKQGASAEPIARHLLLAGAPVEAGPPLLEATRAALAAGDARSAEELSSLLGQGGSASVRLELADARARAQDLLAEFDGLAVTLASLEESDASPSRRLSEKARQAHYALRTGDLAHAFRLYRELAQTFEENEQLEDAAEASLGAQDALQERGESAQAVPFAESAYQISRRIENGALEARALIALGRLAYATSDLGQAIRLFEQSRVKATEAGERGIEGHAYRWNGAALALAGAIERAKDELQRAERRLGAIPDVVGSLEARVLLASLELDEDLASRLRSLERLHEEASNIKAPGPFLLSGLLLARTQVEAGLDVEAAGLGDALIAVATKKAPRFLCALESTTGIAEGRLGAPSGRRRVETALRRMESSRSSEHEEPFRIYAYHSEILGREGQLDLSKKQWKRTEQILHEVEARLPSALRPGFLRRPVVRAILDRGRS